MISILDTLSLLWPFSRGGSRARTIRCEAVECSRINAEAADCSRVNAEAAECSRVNAEAIGFGGVFYMKLKNGEKYRTAPLKSGTAGPRVQLRFEADPVNSGDEHGPPLVSSDIASITLTAYSCTPHPVTGDRNYQGAEITGYDGIDISVGSVFYDTLQPWIDDELGYNFSYLVPADMFEGTSDGDYGQIKVEVELESTGEVRPQYIEGKILF